MLSITVSNMKFLILAIALITTGCISAPQAQENPYTLVPASAVVFITNGHACSAVAVSDHELYTAAHCVDNDKEIAVDYGNAWHTGYVTWADPELDLATVDMRAPLFTSWAHAHMEELRAGDEIVQVGYGCDTQVRLGTFLGSNAMDGRAISNVETCGGDSGGGLFTTSGGLVGIVQAKSIKHPDWSYARSPWY